jgi:hypothetical protein
MSRSSLPAAVLGVALLAPCVAAAQTPTLGELARKEQERRKTLTPAGKVVTNQDVPRAVAPPPAADAASQGAGAAKVDKPDAAAKPEAPKPGEPVKDEAWWKQRIGQVREELRRNEMFAEALQTRINSLTGDFTRRDDPYQRARIADDRAKALLEMDRVKADLESNRKALAAIEEEARASGVPPGWLR